MIVYKFGDLAYEPVVPRIDNAEECERYPRLIYQNSGQPELFRAAQGELTSGWVVGIFLDRRSELNEEECSI